MPTSLGGASGRKGREATRDIRFLFAYDNFPNWAMQAKNAPPLAREREPRNHHWFLV